MKKFDVVTLGEAMVMLTATEAGPLEEVRQFEKRAAGAELNVSIGLARLGLAVSWASRLGQDSLGRYLRATLEAEGVDCSHVEMCPEERTGFQFKAQASGGQDPVVEYHRKGSAASRMQAADLREDWLRAARHLHVTGVFPAIAPNCTQAALRAMAVARQCGAGISFDPNLRPTLWRSQDEMRDTLNALASHADTVLPGLAEGEFLTGHSRPEDIARFFLDRGARRVVIKLGLQGAFHADREQGSGEVPAFEVPHVVDTVGAGDGFATGVISALLEGRNTAEAARRGAWIGACAIQSIGDYEGLPTRAQLQEAGL